MKFWVQIAVTVGISLLTYLIAPFITSWLKKKGDKEVEELKNNYSRSLQVDSFYRETGSTEIIKLIDDWSHYLNIADAPDDVPDVFKLKSKTLTFGSRETATILSRYFEFMDFNKKKDLSDPFTPYSAEMILYVAALISSLKYDYTGAWVSPMNIMKIYSGNMTEYGDIYKKAYLLVQNDVPFLKIMG